MINLAISMPGQFYRDAITKALEKTGKFRIRPLEEYTKETQVGAGLGRLLTMEARMANKEEEACASSRKPAEQDGMQSLPEASTAREGPPITWNTPEIALLGVSVYQGYTLKERQEIIREIKERAPACRIVLFVDELVSPEQTEGITTLRQARLIDGFLYASGTMEYLIATLESI